MKKNKVAVLFLAHFVSESNLKKYAKLKRELRGKCEALGTRNRLFHPIKHEFCE